jgi:uncharacterized membrane protein
VKLRVLALVAIVFGIFFRGYHIDQKTFWEDEILGTVRMLGFTEAELVSAAPQIRSAGDVQVFYHDTQRHPPLATLSAMALEDPQHPPLYYLLVRFWAALFGTSVMAMRLLPVIFGMAALVPAYALARELLGAGRAPLIMTALLAVSPFAVLYSQEARDYALWSLVTLIASWLLLRAIRTGRRGYWWGYGVVSLLGLYTSSLSALTMMAHGAFMLLGSERRKRSVLVPYLVASGAAAILFIPWLLNLDTSVLTRGAVTMMAAKLTLAQIALAFLRDIKAAVIDFGPGHAPPVRLLVTVVGTALLVMIAYGLWYLRRAPETVRTFIATLLVIPAAPLLLHDLLSGGIFSEQGRYFVPVYLALALLLTNLFSGQLDPAAGGPAPRTAWSALFVLTLVGGFVSCAISADATTWYNKDYERTPEVTALINSAPRPLVVGDLATSRVFGLTYYLHSDVAMRLNLHCDLCMVEEREPRNVWADASASDTVFALGNLPVPKGFEATRRIGVKLFPQRVGPLDMFATGF